ncbi:MAG TPA: hypothetical protein DD640_03520 [Clostridiales bacterium]|nr:hypothetical protein [Clostridiales bacterium]
MLFKLLRLYVQESWNSRSLGYLALMFLLTAFLLGSLPEAGNGGQSEFFQPVSVSVVDEDQSLISFTLVDQFADISLIDQIYLDDLDTARRRLDGNEILLILVIPAGFYEQTVQGQERSGLSVYLNENMPSEATVFVRLLKNISGSVEVVQASLYAFQDALRPLAADTHDLSDKANAAGVDLVFKLIGRKSIVRVNEETKLSTSRYVVSALACLLAMLTALLVLLQVQQERRSGLHERLLLAGVPWWQLMLAKQLIGLIWLAAGFAPLLAVLFRYYPDARRWPVILAIILLYWTASAFCLILGYLGRTSETLLMGAWLGILALLLLGGCIYPLQLLPGWLQPVSALSPARWSFALIYADLSGQGTSLPAALALAGMVLLLSAGSWLACRRARPAV